MGGRGGRYLRLGRQPRHAVKHDGATFQKPNPSSPRPCLWVSISAIIRSEPHKMEDTPFSPRPRYNLVDAHQLKVNRQP